MDGILGVEIIILASSTPIKRVWCLDLHHPDPGLLCVAEEARAIASGGLDADAVNVADDRIQVSIYVTTPVPVFGATCGSH